MTAPERIGPYIAWPFLVTFTDDTRVKLQACDENDAILTALARYPSKGGVKSARRIWN